MWKYIPLAFVVLPISHVDGAGLLLVKHDSVTISISRFPKSFVDTSIGVMRFA